MREVVIVSAKRTAIGKMGGTLKNVPAEVLGETALRGVLDETGIPTQVLGQVILGHCRQSSDNPNIARIAALKAGVDEAVPAFTVMRQCASGMTALGCGWSDIRVDVYNAALVGGVESMSTAPFYIRGARFGLGTGNTQLLDSVTEVQFNSQPADLYGRFNMGQSVDDYCRKAGITRQEQDEFAQLSQEKAARAISSGRFTDEIVPVTVRERKAELVFDTDEFPRLTSLEKLAALKPAFRENGTVTAGNASGRNDGASALLIMTREKAAELGLKPLAVVRQVASAALDPREWFLGPVPAVQKILRDQKLSLKDFGLIEMNEAFAGQCIGCMRLLGYDQELLERTNVNGGAIALGHPVGNSGARIVVTLLHEMLKRQTQLGIATLCVAGGLGMAAMLELC